MAPGFRRKRSGDRDDTSSPVLITEARQSYQEELAARKKRYFLLMSVRIPALLLAAGSLSIWNNPWIALAIVAVSIPIPWIAVVGANDRPPLPKGQARTYNAGRLPAPRTVALPPGLTGKTSSQSSTDPEREAPVDDIDIDIDFETNTDTAQNDNTGSDTDTDTDTAEGNPTP